MDTIHIKETRELSRAAALLRRGELAAVPTETVYGLAANGLDEKAVAAIYEVKGRPENKALSLMVPGSESIGDYCEDVPPCAYALAKRFWPGPLTLILKSRDCVPEIVRAGGETVGLRCPDHPMTLELLRLAGVPFAAPSANPSGEESPKDAQKVADYFEGKIAAIVDGGPCGFGRESTILDLSRAPYRILRQGALPKEAIVSALREELTLIGITGGSGSGKTTVLRALEARGALCVDCDALYHELLETDETLLREIEEAFPGTVENGRLQRKALGESVFADGEKLRTLNRITHRHILAALEERLSAFALSGGSLAAVDAIELIGSGLADSCAFTIGVIADREARLQRIMLRDCVSRTYAELRLKAQPSDEFFRENCTYVLENNGTPEQLLNKTNELLKEALSHGREER